MLARIRSYGLSGLDGCPVLVEVDVSGGMPAYETVGLPDAAVRESRERVRAAIKNSGFDFPVGRITVSLAPADMRKEGSVYDLAIAVGILAATAQIPAGGCDKTVFLGELALDGRVRGVRGILPMVIGARGAGMERVILPEDNANEAAYIESIAVLPAQSLGAVAAALTGKAPIAPCPPRLWSGAHAAYASDFSEIKGQQGAKRAAEIAVAGGHNMLLIGTPGSGKTMLARSIPSILPELTKDEALEITKIHSVAGTLRSTDGVVYERPYRAPHHSASAASLIGGGPHASPGEISLAHFGVLFLDEFPEFKKDVLEAMRQPLEDGSVTITRAAARSTYPAEFMLIAAMNPCPCGNFGSRITPCRCTASQIARYRNRISGPMLNRVDLYVEMGEVGYSEITSKADAEPSSAIRERVNGARRLEAGRYREDGILFNAQLTGRLIKKYCALDPSAEALLKRAFESLRLSARAYTRILKVARTIADLDGGGAILSKHVAEAIQYRSLESKYWSN